MNGDAIHENKDKRGWEWCGYGSRMDMEKRKMIPDLGML